MTRHPEVNYFYQSNDMAAHVARIDSVYFWRGVNPHLTITAEPFAGSARPYTFGQEDIDRAVSQVTIEGYLQTRPTLPVDHCQALSQGVHNIIAAGFHPIYLTLYDEYWQTMQRITSVMEPVLGPGCYPLGDYWAWCISKQTAGAGWGPHRDYQFKSRTLREDGRPTLVTVWLPFTDATTLNGCMYLIPMDRDDNLPDHPENYHFGDLQDIRALPAQAGTVLAWNQYVMHWGSRCSQFAQGPRISTGIYFQSADYDPYVGKPVDFKQPLPFERRLGFVASNMLNYHQYHSYPTLLLDMCFRQVQALPNFASLVPSTLLELMP
ncbi:phytanoyl-CoA dioxygenase family protein [bacterium]|nr:phytanoyl-CoA dioxygenase family protein [bacterium]